VTGVSTDQVLGNSGGWMSSITDNNNNSMITRLIYLQIALFMYLY